MERFHWPGVGSTTLKWPPFVALRSYAPQSPGHEHPSLLVGAPSVPRLTPQAPPSPGPPRPPPARPARPWPTVSPSRGRSARVRPAGAASHSNGPISRRAAPLPPRRCLLSPRPGLPPLVLPGRVLRRRDPSLDGPPHKLGSNFFPYSETSGGERVDPQATCALTYAVEARRGVGGACEGL